MAIITIEGYTPMSTGRIALGADGSIWRYQPNIPAGMIQLEPPGTIPPMTREVERTITVTTTRSAHHAGPVHR